MELPQRIAHVKVPPIKCQGIKTRLVPFIARQIQWRSPPGRWLEPCLGSGVVAFNLAPPHAILADTNCHIISFYQAIQRGTITPDRVRQFLQREGAHLAERGESHYYAVRDRFNQSGYPLDFLFLNRACFNGLMRFNRQGQFNVPFCRKPQRFTPSYITKITNQVAWVAQQMRDKDWEFRVAPWQLILKQAERDDFVYLDPPYIGRHTDYFNVWTTADAQALAIATQNLPCGFAVSMWQGNHHRTNPHIADAWTGTTRRTCAHFYHVGAKEAWRGAMAEALLLHPQFAVPDCSVSAGVPSPLG